MGGHFVSLCLAVTSTQVRLIPGLPLPMPLPVSLLAPPPPPAPRPGVCPCCGTFQQGVSLPCLSSVGPRTLSSSKGSVCSHTLLGAAGGWGVSVPGRWAGGSEASPVITPVLPTRKLRSGSPRVSPLVSLACTLSGLHVFAPHACHQGCC